MVLWMGLSICMVTSEEVELSVRARGAEERERRRRRRRRGKLPECQ